jgi:hypothetical protein
MVYQSSSKGEWAVKFFVEALAAEDESGHYDEITTAGPEQKPMSKTIDAVITEKAAEIAADEIALRKKKEMVNTLCTVDGRPAMYAMEDNNSVPTQIRSDQFYGQPLASAVRTILEMRKQRSLGAATNREIYDALKAGGYEFDTKSEDIAQKSLRNSLAKNTALFHKLPNGQFGLLSWYPNVKKPKHSLPVEDPFAEPEHPTNAQQDAIADEYATWTK